MPELEEAAQKLHEEILSEQTPEEPVKEEIPPQEEDAEVDAESETEVTSEKDEEEPAKGAENEAETIELDAEQLANLLGLKSDNLEINDEGQIRFKGKVKDEIVDATPAELIDAYQQQAYLTNRSKEIAEQRKQADELVQNLQSQHEQQIQQYAAFLEMAENELLAPYQNIPWDELRSKEPGKYAALKADLDEAKSRFKGMQDQVVEHLQTQQNTINEQITQKQQEFMSKQRETLSQREWWNDNTAQEITSFLKGKGFSEQEISSTADARAIEMAYHAMLYEKGMQKATEKSKKPIPKVVKPGAKQSATTINLQKQKELRKNLKKSGSLEDAVALLKMTGK